MTHRIYEFFGATSGKVSRGDFSNSDAALAQINERSKFVFAEEDADHPGFWDVYADGRLFTIEPVAA